MFTIQSRTRRSFVNPDKINHHLFCPICLDVFEEPSRLICGHTFCYMCIQHWIKSINKHICAQCKGDFSRRKLQKDMIASKMVDDLEVRCLHPGCSWTGKHSAHRKHQRNCEWRQKKQIKGIGNDDKIVVINDPQQQIMQVSEIEAQIVIPQLETIVLNPQNLQNASCVNISISQSANNQSRLESEQFENKNNQDQVEVEYQESDMDPFLVMN